MCRIRLGPSITEALTLYLRNCANRERRASATDIGLYTTERSPLFTEFLFPYTVYNLSQATMSYQRTILVEILYNQGASKSQELNCYI